MIRVQMTDMTYEYSWLTMTVLWLIVLLPVVALGAMLLHQRRVRRESRRRGFDVVQK